MRFYELDTPIQLPKNVNFTFVLDGSNPGGLPYGFPMDSVDKVFDKDTVIYGYELKAGDTLRIPEGNAIALPLNAAADTVTYFCLLPDGQYTDTFRLKYGREFSIYDKDCDPSLTYINLDTVSQTFDSMVVSGNVTNIQISTNIEVYL